MEYIWLGQRQVSICCEHGGFYKTWRISWLAEEMLVFQWFCTRELEHRLSNV